MNHKQFTVHYKLRNGKTGRQTITALCPFDAVLVLLHQHNLAFRDLAGVLAKNF